MSEERRTDQKFAVFCYAIAVMISTVLSAIVQMAGATGNLLLYLCYLLPQVGYIGVFSYMFFMRNKNPFRALLRKEDVKGWDYPFAFLAAVGLLFFALLPNHYIVKLFGIMGLNATVVVPQFTAWYDYPLCLIILCVLPAIGEELIFRKAFLDGMEEVADGKAVLLCGLAFALSHFNPAQTVHQFFLGCVLAGVYVKTKNITLTMLMHFTNNCIAVFLERFTGSEIWNTVMGMAISCAVGAVVLVGSLTFLWIKGKKFDNRKQGKIENATWILIGALAVVWILMTVVAFLK